MTKRRVLVWAAPLFLGAAMLGLFLTRARADEKYPDTQKLIIDNPFVRVFDIRVPPGTFEAKHSHGRGLTIAMSDYDNETTSFPEKKVNRGHTALGDVKWVEPVTHEARNIGTTEQHVIRIELK